VPPEVTTDLTMLERLAAPAGRDVVDIGCGGGALVRQLSARGARMTGIEISGEQLATALAQDDGTGARYLIGDAQSLPLADESMDLALFMKTLHHVPPADLPTALGEARRVLRPRGSVYVAEPLPEGDYFTLTSLVEDELAVREAAQAALAGAAAAGLQRATTVDYEVRVRIAGIDAYRDRTVSVDPARAAVFDARRDEIAAALARLGEAGERPGERVFLVPMRADLLAPVRSAR
jgi:SAM-dependent methyltransferase